MINNREKEEYSELMQWMRFYGNIRFAILTVFAGLTAGILTFAVKADPKLADSLQFALKIGGILVTVVFWVAELSAAIVWRHLAARAVALERLLSYEIFSTMRDAPRFRYMPTTYFVSVFYLCILIFWAVSIIFPTLFQ